MPTFIKTGFWDKLISNNPQQAKAPKGWLNLDNFVQTLIPPTPPSTNIYNSDGTLNSDRQIDAAMQSISWSNFNNYTIDNFNTFRFILNGFFIGIFSSPQFFLHRFGEWNQIPSRNNFTAFLECDINTGISKLSGSDTINGMDLLIGNSIIESKINSTQRGIKITTTNALLGEELSGNNVFLDVNYAGFIKTNFVGSNIGLNIDFGNKLYQFGQITGNNATTLKIDDAAAFPVQVSGTNVTQNTSGTASGKFLKIKVDGVDYVIELKNPS